MKGLAKFLKDKLDSQWRNPLWIEDPYGGGNTDLGFESTYTLNYEELEKEINSFIESFK